MIVAKSRPLTWTPTVPLTVSPLPLEVTVSGPLAVTVSDPLDMWKSTATVSVLGERGTMVASNVMCTPCGPTSNTLLNVVLVELASSDMVKSTRVAPSVT